LLDLEDEVTTILPHGVASQKTLIYSNTDVRTSNPGMMQVAGQETGKELVD
jgi:hypothetical protein